MKLRKTKSAVAVLLAVMLLVSTMIVAPVSASAATAGEAVGDWDNTTVNYVHYSFDNTNWADAVVTNQDGKYLTPEIEIPEGVTTIHVAFSVEWDNNARWFKQGPASREIQPVFGDENGRFYAYLESTDQWEPGQYGEGTDLLDIPVRPTSKITFRYIDFNNLTTPKEFVYGCYMSSLPTDAVKSAGDVSIEVDPESDVYTASRDVTISVTNIPADLPLDQVTVDTHFGKGTFVPANTQNDATNHTITITGVLNGFTANDIGTGYVAEATASSTYTYTDAQNVTYTFTQSSATDTYDIEDIPVVPPTEQNEYITVTLTVDPTTIGEDETATLTATVSYPSVLPDDQVQYVGVTVTDDAAGTNVLQPSQTSPDADNNKIEYTYILNENTYSADNSPIRFTANPTYTGSDYLDTAQNILYHFIPVGPAYADLTVTASYETVTEYVTISLSVDPTSMVYDGSAVVTAVMTAPEHFPAADITSIGANLSENTGKTLPGASVSNTQNTVTEVYTLPAGFFTANDIGTVTFTAAANINPAVADVVDTANRKIYHFEVGQPATANLTLIDYGTEAVSVGTLDVTVTPASDYNSAARTVTAVLSDISQFIDNATDIDVTMTDNKGNTLTNPTVTVGTDTVTYVYTVAANTYPNAADTVTYTGTASYDQTKTVGNTVYSFIPCSDTAETEIILDTLDPDLTPVGFKLTLLAGLKTSIGLQTAKLNGYENVRMVVKNTAVPGGVELTGYVDGVLTLFDFDKVYPHLVVDDLECVIYATKNGVEYHSNPYIRSVRTYCYDTLSNYANNQTTYGITLKRTLVELLDYAAAVQTKKNYKTNDLANAALTNEQKAYATSSSDCENIDNKDYVVNPNAVATWYQAALVFDSNIQYKLSFKTTVMPEEGWYAIAKANTVEHRIDTIQSSTGYSAGQIADYYIINIDDLWVSQIDSPITVTLYDKDGNAISNTMKTSIASFSARRTDLNATDRAVVDAMMKYGRAAMELSKFM